MHFATSLRQSDAVLVSVRRPDKFATGQPPGAVNIEITAADFSQRIARVTCSMGCSTARTS